MPSPGVAVFSGVFLSLRGRLLLLVLLASLPGFAITVYAGLEQRRVATRWSIDVTQHRARDFAAEQDRIVEMTRHLLTALARLPEVRRLDGPACSALFADLLRQYPEYSNMSAIEPDGDVFCSAVPSPRPVNLADRPYFQRVLRARDFVVGEYIVGRITGLPSTPLVYPALDESGRVVVVVSAALDLSWLNRVATAVRLPEGGAVIVTDREGTILIRYPDHDRWAGRPAPFFNNISGASEGTFEASGVDGVRRLYAFTSFGDPQRGDGAKVSVGFPVAGVYAEANRLLLRNLVLLGLAVGLTLLLAWSAGDMLVLRRVRRLLGVIGRLKAGDLAARSGPSASSGELDILAAAFDEMAEAVQSRITERERAEEEVRQLNAELEQRVADRTAQIETANRGLRQAHELAEQALTEADHARTDADRANRAKSEFLSRMSHELRTPLNAVLGFGQLLEMDDLTPTQREGVAQILKGGRHLLDLINEVLDIARIEAGRMSLSPEPIPVGMLIQESMDLVASMAAERHVHLLLAEAGEAAERFVLADRQRLKQVLLNLLSNAIKFNSREGTVTLSYEDVPRGRLRLKVRDTGPGIPLERMERLFVPFERLGADEVGVEGTGLGLALSRHLVEAMGGVLGIESEVGVGSTFWVELLAVESALQGMERAGVALPAPVDLEASALVRIVLYIEDNSPNMKLMQHLIAHRPEVRLIPAMQGRLGLELARDHRPHLVLLDLHLPDISGDEVLRLLQESPKTKGIPVVVISADATPVRIKQLIEAGARDYLTKPLDVKKLMGIMDSFLGQG